ncbi:hypothetical protein [Anaerospora hongkongensis]|uniref:hypothetical protein n=1 Tax=Anaerospora hongkongensis TaxID=244830 RepID=UPI00289E08C3|nr:hypothetical protein [Anaerospora hongkongensis]
MLTTSRLIQLLYDEVQTIAQDADFLFPGEKGKLSHPIVYKYFLPPRNKIEQTKRAYIALQLGKEKQDMQQDTDSIDIHFQLVFGLYHDSVEVAEGLDTLVSALERLEIVLKDIGLLDQNAEMVSIEKEISHEQPIPYLEGVIRLHYTYYKPVKRYEP